MQLTRALPCLAAALTVAALAAPAAKAAADITDDEIALMCNPGQTVVELTVDQAEGVRGACNSYSAAIAAAQAKADDATAQAHTPGNKASATCVKAPAGKPKVRARARLCKTEDNVTRHVKRQERIITLQHLADIDTAKQAFIDDLGGAGVFDDES